VIPEAIPIVARLYLDALDAERRLPSSADHRAVRENAERRLRELVTDWETQRVEQGERRTA
jgi:hypothetical protein